ncbi:MAG: MFS transporter [Chloroflexota bacterium]|nr:MFS transporter [Chloroflexota bacterium]
MASATGKLAGGGGGAPEAAPGWITKLGAGFRALRHRNYRLFFFGQFISLIGTWMQSVAQAWLVLSLAGKDGDLLLGVTTALQFTPVLLFSVFGGALADRLPKRSVLMVTQSVMLVLALVLAVLNSLGIVQVWHVLVLAALLGTTSAIDMPTRQAFIVELVGKDDLMNSIALNSSVFNAARIIGPGVAGLLIHWVGVSGCFYLNAASFLAVLTGMALMRPPFFTRPGAAKGGAPLSGGFRYIWHTPDVRALMILVGVVGTFGLNLTVWMPVLARDVLGVGAAGYGVMMSAMGVGALAAGLLLAYRGKKAQRSLVLAAAGIFGIVLLAVAVTRWFPVTLGLMAVMGAAMVAFSATANTTVQLLVPDELRGRVMAVYMMVFAGTTPIGSLLAGGIAHALGTPASIAAGAGTSLLAVIALWLGMRRESPAAGRVPSALPNG